MKGIHGRNWGSVGRTRNVKIWFLMIPFSWFRSCRLGIAGLKTSAEFNRSLMVISMPKTGFQFGLGRFQLAFSMSADEKLFERIFKLVNSAGDWESKPRQCQTLQFLDWRRMATDVNKTGTRRRRWLIGWKIRRRSVTSGAEARFDELNMSINSTVFQKTQMSLNWTVFRELMSAGKVSIEVNKVTVKKSETGIWWRVEQNILKFIWRRCAHALSDLLVVVAPLEKAVKLLTRMMTDLMNLRMTLRSVTPDSLIEMALTRQEESVADWTFQQDSRAWTAWTSWFWLKRWGARRSSGLPRWWLIGPTTLLYCGEPPNSAWAALIWLSVKLANSKEVLDQINSGDLSVRESRRKTPTISDVPSALDSSSEIIRSLMESMWTSWIGRMSWLSFADWSWLWKCCRDLKKKPPRNKLKHRNAVEKLRFHKCQGAKETKSPESEGTETSQSTGKHQKSPRNLKRKQQRIRLAAKSQAAEIAPIPSVDDFPGSSSQSFKRQRTLTDFGSAKSK